MLAPAFWRTGLQMTCNGPLACRRQARGVEQLHDQPLVLGRSDAAQVVTQKRLTQRTLGGSAAAKRAGKILDHAQQAAAGENVSLLAAAADAGGVVLALARGMLQRRVKARQRR